MLKSELIDLLNRNSISTEDLNNTLYNTLLLSVFETICIKMKDHDVKQFVLDKFRSHHNHLELIRQICFTFTGCVLSDKECSKIFEWLIAYFRKDTIRKKYTEKFKADLLEKQNFACAICKKPIELNTSELDHIIPWDFVGDELQNNLQLLCNLCNERKGRSISFHLKLLLIKDNGELGIA